MSLSKKTKDKIGEYSVYITIGLVIFLIYGFPVIKDVYESYKQDNSTITNKELQEFQEWSQKQQEKEFNNSIVK